MVVRDSGLEMGVGRNSRLRRGVGVLAMPDARQDTTRRIESVCEVHPGAGVLRLLIPGIAVGVIIDCRCVADGVTVTLPATPEMLSEDEGVEF
jgi:hypothetical protein